MPALKLLVAGVTWPAETFLQNRWQGLARAGVEVTVATAAPRSRGPFDLAGVRVVRLPHWEDPAPARAWRAAWDGAASGQWSSLLRAGRGQWSRLPAYAALARLKPDLVHFEWNSAAMDYEALLDLWRCPVVISCRGGQIQVRPHVPGQEEFAAGLARGFQRASAVHCVSEAIRNEAVRYGLDPARARVIRPAVEAAFFRPPETRRAADGLFRVVSTGALGWVKGYEYALTAVRLLADRGVPVRFDILGDGKKAERQRVEYTIRDLRLEEVVTLRGALPPEQVRDALQQADAFLLSSLSEGISNAALEAMACGLPVVVTDCGGLREVVSDGVEGFLTPVRDPQAWAEALERLAADPARRERMGFAARDRVLAGFTAARQTGQFLELYRGLVQ